MKTRFAPKILRLAASALLFPSLQATAGEFTTVPLGSITIQIAAGTGVGSYGTFFSIPLMRSYEGSEKSEGQISAVTADSLSDSSAGWSSNAFSQTGAPHFVRITSGPAAGHMFQILSNTATTLTLNNAGVALDQKSIVTGANGDGYEIIPAETLSSLFGAPTPDFPIVGAVTHNQPCDQIFVMENGVWIAFFYNTSVSQWRRGGLPISQNNKILPPNSPIFYSRIGNTSMTFKINGRISNSKNVLLIQPASDTGTTTFFPVNHTLGSLNFQALPGWKKVGDPGITTSNADQVSILENGAWNSYQYNATLSQWRKGALPFSQNNKVIPSGTGIVITRNGTTGIAELEIPIPYSLE